MKKKHHIIRNVLICLCLVGVLSVSSVGWLAAWVAEQEFDANYEFERTRQVYSMETDCIIVLGAQVKAWGEPSEALLRRMQQGLKNYNETPRIIICCGGQGADEPVAEGDFMREWYIKQGVPESMVLSENTSVNTQQNLEFAKRIMGEFGLTSALIVSSDYHVPRALAIAKDLGIQAEGSGSASRPDLWWKNHLREGASWIKYWIGL
jgi:uncharacterized SAM-binding protein YcdF (DUF218 family)